MSDQKRDLRQVCLSAAGRSALDRGLKARFPSFPNDIKAYRWKEVTQVDLRTVRRMLTPGEHVRNASVIAVFADLGVEFDHEQYLGSSDDGGETAPALGDQDPAPPGADSPPPFSQPEPESARGGSDGESRPAVQRLRPVAIWGIAGALAFVVLAVVAALVVVRVIGQARRNTNAVPVQMETPATERRIVFYDDFTRDTELDSKLWIVNGSALAGSFANLGAVRSTLIAPHLAFDPQSGLGMSGIDGEHQQLGVETVQSFEPPFTVTSEGVAAETHSDSLEVAIVRDDGGSGIGIMGGEGALEADEGFVYVGPQATSKVWSQHGRLSPIPPEDLVSYEMVVRVEKGGKATVAVSSNDHLIGEATEFVGKGPFHVVLGQGSTTQQQPGPNQSYWLASQVIHG